MATDIQQIIRTLEAFYDFSGKTVVHVGAGGGQLMGYAVGAKRIFAIDDNSDTIKFLKSVVENLRLTNVSTLQSDFSDVDASGDVVFFEFCLHEIEDPGAALGKALEMAAEVLILDHAPESQWAWFTAETEKATASWNAVKRFGISRERMYHAVQKFSDYQELYDKIKVLGEPSVSRIFEFKDKKNIHVGMDYTLALIQNES
ncbi:MAG: class I SAM-dependent methyltransferase [Gemmatimonadota bacterium]|nr:MAG: class I SAM-dependent methyltransferase [Gemmatimonadota bacterium]